MSEAARTHDEPVDALKGRYLRAHWFFDDEARGCFAVYERPRRQAGVVAGVKICLRLEVLPLAAGGAKQESLTLELDNLGVQRLARLVAGREPREFHQRLVREGVPPKDLTIYRNIGGANAKADFVMTLAVGQRRANVSFTRADATVCLRLIAKLLKIEEPDLSESFLVENLLADGLYALGSADGR